MSEAITFLLFWPFARKILFTASFSCGSELKKKEKRMSTDLANCRRQFENKKYYVFCTQWPSRIEN
jgi:hypothetical protein